MSLKIAFVAGCPYPVPQGSQAFIRENALALQKRGHDIHLIVYGYGTNHSTDNFQIHRCPNILGENRTSAGPSIKKIWLDLLMVKTVQKVCHEQKIQVLFAHNYEGLIIALLSGFRPVIYHAHNAMSDELPYYFNRGKNFFALLGKYIDMKFPQKANYIITPHERLGANLLLKGIKKEKLCIIPPPVDSISFPVSQIQKDILPPILYTGNLDQYQNLDFLFHVIDRVRKEIPETRLIIGTFEKQKIQGAELVHIGTFDSLKKLLKEDSIMAIPRVSWSGYPIKLLNAMASGKPIVCCESSAYGIQNGFNGIVVPDNDIESFAQSLITLMKTPSLREELGKNARNTIQVKHNPEIIGKTLEDLCLLCIQK
ncbi:MAG: glycosyltransferase family 4 protein [Candidatus Hydrogenedens sp.]